MCKAIRCDLTCQGGYFNANQGKRRVYGVKGLDSVESGKARNESPGAPALPILDFPDTPKGKIDTLSSTQTGPARPVARPTPTPPTSGHTQKISGENPTRRIDTLSHSFMRQARHNSLYLSLARAGESVSQADPSAF